RPEKNPLDLNNLPDDYTRDGKQVFEEGVGGLGQEWCRGKSFNWCCLKQAIGQRKAAAGMGKMSAGRSTNLGYYLYTLWGFVKGCYNDDGLVTSILMKTIYAGFVAEFLERETETLNRARQLVFSNDNLATPGNPGYHPSYHPAGNLGDPTLPFRTVCPPRLFSASSNLMPPTPILQPPQPYLQPSPSRLSSSHLPQYPAHSVNDYYVGHALGSSTLSHSQYHPQNLNYLGVSDSNYTCIGAPVGNGFGHGSTRGADLVGSGRVVSGFRDVTQQHLDHPPTNRFQDGF
ncbi:hypothetical protein Godav_014175, partial [Gossypium davidsonii]|nr:hypothetical protein [Gossypium davidsonii]